MPYADFQTLVTAFLRDDEARISVADRDSAIDRAVIRYSTDRPQMKVVDVVAAGGNVLALPNTWEVNFSELISVEYPIDQHPASYLERDRYRLYRKTDGTDELRFDDALPVGTVRLAFTIKHQLVAGGGGQDTIPVIDRDAVCKWAAADLNDQLASLYSNSQDSTIQADGVQYQNKARERRTQAATYRKQYLDYFGVDDKKSQASGVVVEVPLRDTLGGQRIFHGRRRLH